jgi:hypothetical protein
VVAINLKSFHVAGAKVVFFSKGKKEFCGFYCKNLPRARISPPLRRSTPACRGEVVFFIFTEVIYEDYVINHPHPAYRAPGRMTPLPKEYLRCLERRGKFVVGFSVG